MKICCRACLGSKTIATKKMSHVGQMNPAAKPAAGDCDTFCILTENDLQSNLNFLLCFALALPVTGKHE